MNDYVISLICMLVFFGSIFAWIILDVQPRYEARAQERRDMYSEHCKDKDFFDLNAEICVALQVEPEE